MDKFGNESTYEQQSNESIDKSSYTDTSSTQNLNGHKRSSTPCSYFSDYYIYLIEELCHLAYVEIIDNLTYPVL